MRAISKFLFFAIFILVFVFGFNFLLNRGKFSEFLDIFSRYTGISIAEKELPAPTDPQDFIFKWKYGNKNYSLDFVLHKSSYEFYASLPKKYTCFSGFCKSNWEDEYFKMFLMEVKNDDTIERLAGALDKLAKQNSLDESGRAEFVLSFVQSIPYDELKAKTNEPLPRYPYEVLFDKKGICSDKTFLAASLLKQLGYGVALFDYEGNQHIAPAIKCPKEYSSYNSGYCYAETTGSGFKIGEIPTVDSSNNLAIVRTPFGESPFKANENRIQLSNPKIFEISDGKSYEGIIKQSQRLKKIEELEKQIMSLNASMLPLKNQVENATIVAENYKREADVVYARYKNTLSDEDYNNYSGLFDKYNEAYKNYQNLAQSYNNQASNYNNLVRQYNLLISE